MTDPQTALRQIMVADARVWRRRVIGCKPHAKLELMPPPPQPPDIGRRVSAAKKATATKVNAKKDSDFASRRSLARFGR